MLARRGHCSPSCPGPRDRSVTPGKGGDKTTSGHQATHFRSPAITAKWKAFQFCHRSLNRSLIRQHTLWVGDGTASGLSKRRLSSGLQSSTGKQRLARPAAHVEVRGGRAPLRTCPRPGGEGAGGGAVVWGRVSQIIGRDRESGWDSSARLGECLLWSHRTCRNASVFAGSLSPNRNPVPWHILLASPV